MIALHKQAGTTPAVRAEIAASQEAVSRLARRHPVTTATLRKWQSRTDFPDRSHIAHHAFKSYLPGYLPMDSKTDWADAQWLATLARSGRLRASFVPPAKLRQLRHVARQRQQLVGILSGEKNRVHKVLSDGGIRLSVVVSDIPGVAGRAMVKALIEGQSPAEVLRLAGNRLKAERGELLDALDGDLTAEHRFVLRELRAHVQEWSRASIVSSAISSTNWSSVGPPWR